MKKKAMAAGVSAPAAKAPSKKGAWIDVQKRTLATAKAGKKK
jgi:hypothetical protein